MRILVSGSLAYDRIMDFPGRFADHILPDKLDILNVCFMVGGLKEQFGGTAGNIAYSLALLGEKPLIIATCGTDSGQYIQRIKDLGLSLEGVLPMEGVLTAGAYITSDESGNQITTFNPGAMDHPSGYNFDDLDPSDALAVVSPGNLEDMRSYSRKYKALGAPYIFDPGQSIPAFSGPELTEMITGSNMLISNDYELEMIMQASGLKREDIQERTERIIVTLGEKGSVIWDKGAKIEVGAVEVEQAVDPTGAGDAYRSGLIAGLAAGRSLEKAAQMGATCASFAVEKLGTQVHRFTVDEFWARHEKTWGRQG